MGTVARCGACCAWAWAWAHVLPGWWRRERMGVRACMCVCVCKWVCAVGPATHQRSPTPTLANSNANDRPPPRTSLPLHTALPQEIVFIGASMDRAAIERQLDSALLTDKGGNGFRFYGWKVGRAGGGGHCGVRAAQFGACVCVRGARSWRLPLPEALAPLFCTAGTAEMEQYRTNYAKQPDPPRPGLVAMRQQQ